MVKKTWGGAKEHENSSSNHGNELEIVGMDLKTCPDGVL